MLKICLKVIIAIKFIICLCMHRRITTDSELHKMVREEGAQKVRGGGGQRGRGGDTQPIYQSPSVRALESKYVVDDVGISDF